MTNSFSCCSRKIYRRRLRGLDQDAGEGSGDVTGVQVGLAVGDEVGEFL
jgi:hypothetical protein